MNFHYDNDDTGSFSSSVCTSDYDIPEDMTEERAMEIWLRRDREIEERLQRERQQRREMEEAQPPEEVVLEQQLQQQQQTSSNHGVSHERSSSASSDAAHTHSEAWRRDPANRHAWNAYQQFLEITRPGVAENFVPSTPGLARLIEEQRQVLAEERRRDAQQNRVALAAQPSGLGIVDGGPQDPRVAAQAQEYDRQAHRTEDADSIATAAASAPSDKSQKKNNTSLFYLATPRTTEYNTKPVTCFPCNITLYTHPLAQNYFCQTCCKISTLHVDEGKSEETRWEEKMMDRGDYYDGDVDMAY